MSVISSITPLPSFLVAKGSLLMPVLKPTLKPGVLLCNAAFVMVGITGNMIGPTYDGLTHRYGIPLSDGATFTSISAIGGTLSVLLAGRLLDRINARYVLATGAAAMGIALLILINT